MHAAIVLRRTSQITLAAMDKVIRVFVQPRMIRRHVIRNKIEHQLQSAFLQALPQTCKCFSPAEIAMNRIVLNGKA